MLPSVHERKSSFQPLDAEYARLHRILQIIQLIQQQNGWDAKALARACGVAERTIYRDLKLLEGANIPFSYDDERRCYRIRPDFFMRPIELSLDEALALVALGEEIGKKEQIPFTMAAARAVAKIRGQLPEKVRRELKAIDQHMAIRLGEAGASDGVADVFSKVQAAQAQHRCLRCRYESVRSDGFKKSFLLKPYKLCLRAAGVVRAGASRRPGRRAIPEAESLLRVGDHRRGFRSAQEVLG